MNAISDVRGILSLANISEEVVFSGKGYYTSGIVNFLTVTSTIDVKAVFNCFDIYLEVRTFMEDGILVDGVRPQVIPAFSITLAISTSTWSIEAVMADCSWSVLAIAITVCYT